MYSRVGEGGFGLATRNSWFKQQAGSNNPRPLSQKQARPKMLGTRDGRKMALVKGTLLTCGSGLNEFLGAAEEVLGGAFED